ncbi:hypothetical protein [uncultured Algibacter sp.]|uniref:hypothetical protein n=1 Tax=uncultured Algibacter sp. TaxID=298659 RepID=UPI0026272B60|nr:hypothetical protein [uncultured Algibacter sp.]
MKKSKNFDIQINNQLASIGLFVVEFESILEWIRFDCSAILQYVGLEQWGLSDVIFGQKVFTAGPLLNCYEQICNELINDNDGDKISGNDILKRINDFKKQFDKQIQVRNDLLHSNYQLGSRINKQTNEIEPTELLALKNSPTKQGRNKKITVSSRQEIQNHIDNLIKLKLIQRIIFRDLMVYMSNNRLGKGAYNK